MILSYCKEKDKKRKDFYQKNKLRGGEIKNTMI